MFAGLELAMTFFGGPTYCQGNPDYVWYLSFCNDCHRRQLKAAEPLTCSAKNFLNTDNEEACGFETLGETELDAEHFVKTYPRLLLSTSSTLATLALYGFIKFHTRNS
jgi:hypothetical protein